MRVAAGSVSTRRGSAARPPEQGAKAKAQGDRKRTMEQTIRDRLEQMRGMLQADGGDLEIVGIEGKTVQLRLKGACGGCPHAMVTLKQGIEQALRRDIDEDIVVERVA
jgi:Fe-S cluster biogenesis protein NfuA